MENVFDLMRSGIDASMLGLGHSSIAELSPEDLVIPQGFTYRLGAETCVTLVASESFPYWELCDDLEAASCRSGRSRS